MAKIRFSVAAVAAMTTLLVFTVSIAIFRLRTVAVIWLLMGNTGQFTSGCDSSTTHNNTLFVLRQLSDLITLNVLAGSSVLMVMLLVIMVAIFDSGATITIGRPIAITVSVSILGNPSMDTLGRRMILFVDVRALFVVTVESDRGSGVQSFTLGVILDDLPVLFDRDIYVAQLDLSLLFLFNLGELLPLDGENVAVLASGVDIGDNPDIFDISGDNLLEILES